MHGGVLLIDKPVGPSSAQVVATVKRRLQLKKIGHTGTLDPAASGLLVCVLGRATALAQYAEAETKEYSGTIQLGLTTSSDDLQGEVLERYSDPLPAFSEIKDAATAFMGEIDQIPPQISAVKVKGVRAYKLARNQEQVVPLAARRIVVEQFDLSPLENGQIAFSVCCSKGTYIRSIARDLGRRLGCGGCLASLRRLKVGSFSVVDARGPDMVSAADVLSWTCLFPGMSILELSREVCCRLALGNQKILKEVTEGIEPQSDRAVLLYGPRGAEATGILKYGSNGWQFGVIVSPPADNDDQSGQAHSQNKKEDIQCQR